MVGGGNPGDAGADDGEIEILHEPSHCKVVAAACNSRRTAMNIAHLLLGSAREFRDLPALARGTAPISPIATCGARSR